MKEKDEDKNTFEEPLKVEEFKPKNRMEKRQSKLYVDNDEPSLLRFNSIDRDEEPERRSSTFLYNSEDDVYRIDSSKINKIDDRLLKLIPKNDSAPLKYQNKNKKQLEIVKEELSDNENITKPRDKIEKKNIKNDDDNENKEQNIITEKNENSKNKKKQLILLYIITFSYLIFSIIELVSGYYSNSIILMSDAVNFFSEFVCFIIYIVSIYSSTRNKNKVEILGTLLSSTFLFGFSFWLIFYAIARILQSIYIDGLVIIILGILSTIFNLIIGLVIIFYGIENEINSFKENNSIYNFNSDDELNSRQNKNSFKRLIYTSIQSFLIVIVGIIIYFKQDFFYIDPICSFIFICILLLNAYSNIEKSIKFLMDEPSFDFDINELKNDLLGINGVIEVNNILVYNLSTGKFLLSCDLITSESENLLIEAGKLIKKKYNISYSIIKVMEAII